jgi:transcriptional regulator with XRE-family HTH domain
MKDPTRKIFSERLKATREMRHFSQAQLAEKAAIDINSLKSFEKVTGMMKPSFHTLKLMARGLDVSIDYLLGLTDHV